MACSSRTPNGSCSWTRYGRIRFVIERLADELTGALIFLFPESPRYVPSLLAPEYSLTMSNSWLLDHGHPEKGLATLARLHSNGNEQDPWVKAEFDQIQENITFEHEHEAKSYLELFTNRSSFRRLLIACTLQASVQMTGVSAIQYYSVKIYGQIGISGSDALKYQAINNIIGLLGEACCVLFIDKLGRRRPLISGNLFNMVCLFFDMLVILYMLKSALALLPHRMYLNRYAILIYS